MTMCALVVSTLPNSHAAGWAKPANLIITPIRRRPEPDGDGNDAA
jgi:hypothetical protein